MKIIRYLEHSPVFTILQASREMNSGINIVLEKEGVNFLEALILISLFFEEDRPVRPSDLASVFKTTKGNVSHSITRLQRKKFLQRQMIEEDARGYRIVLAVKGRQAVIRLIRYFDRVQNRFEIQLGSKGTVRFNQQVHLVRSLLLG